MSLSIFSLIDQILFHSLSDFQAKNFIFTMKKHEILIFFSLTILALSKPSKMPKFLCKALEDLTKIEEISNIVVVVNDTKFEKEIVGETVKCLPREIPKRIKEGNLPLTSYFPQSTVFLFFIDEVQDPVSKI